MLMIELFIVLGIAFDLLLLGTLFWKFRLIIAFFTSGLHLSTIALLLLEPTQGLTFFIILLLGFRLINNARIFYDRLHHDHLHALSKRTFLIFAALQLTLLISAPWLASMEFPWLESIAAVQLVTALAILAFVVNSVVQTKFHQPTKHFTDAELPSLTVAIPARNETDDLAACIDTVLSSNYPKLEILVLDDCSQDKTPKVIKQYAHAGVRFIQGKPPTNDWLAKNWAYQQLLDAASGQYILFSGVDVRMSPQYLRNLVSHMKIKRRRMISVLPTRLGGDVRNSFVQPMRYWAELALPRKLLNQPAVLSTNWIIQAKVLKSLGSFKSVKRSILPERYFARECVRHDAYSFIRADENLNVRTAKPLQHQLTTAYRLRYPQFHQRLESIFFYTVWLHAIFVLPYVLFFSGLFISMPSFVQLTSLITISIYTLTHAIILNISDPSNSLTSPFTFPFVVLTEIFLSIYSMLKYEFSDVMWKGRNVCAAVMGHDR